MGAGCIALLMTAALLMQAPQGSLAAVPVGDLSIPVELTKTVRAEKAHRGDPVEFRTVEAVLVSPKLVMPPQTKLFGRVVGAASRQGDKPSWIVLLVERAEWKQHTVPLHAFIASQINLVPPSSQASNSGNSTDTTVATGGSRRAGRLSGRVAAQSDADLSSLTKPPQDATEQPQDVQPARQGTLRDVRIVRDKDGTSYLFSAKSNVNSSQRHALHAAKSHSYGVGLIFGGTAPLAAGINGFFSLFSFPARIRSYRAPWLRPPEKH